MTLTQGDHEDAPILFHLSLLCVTERPGLVAFGSKSYNIEICTLKPRLVWFCCHLLEYTDMTSLELSAAILW